MEQYSNYSLAFGTPDTRKSAAWPFPGQAVGAYAVVSPVPHQASHHQHQYPSHQLSPHASILTLQQQRDQELRLLHQLPLPPLPSPHPHHQHGSSLQHYASGHKNSQSYAALSPVSPYNAQQPFQYSNYPVMAPRPLRPNPAQSATPALPLPRHILPSQETNRVPCMACGKQECRLSSHRHFSKYVLSNARKRKSRRQDEPPGGDVTPRPSTAVPVSASSIPPTALHPPLQLDAEREHLLALWSQPWSPRSESSKAPTRRSLERHLFPTPFIDRVLPAARNHPPLLQCLLACSGTPHAIANPQFADHATLAAIASNQQMLAVDLLSQACPSETEASSDEAMLAATLLLLIYLAQGNAFEVSKHVNGLIHLVAGRGGLHYLGMGGVVAEVLSYADWCQAVWFGTEPVWGFVLPALEMRTGVGEVMGRSFRQLLETRQTQRQGQGQVPLGLAPVPVQSQAHLEESLLRAALSVCKVADVFEWAAMNPDAPLPREAKNSFGYLSMIAEYQLAKCNASLHNNSTLEECVCLALILFNKVILRASGAVTPDILAVEYRFWTALEEAERKGNMHEMVQPKMYMWMCFMGLSVNVPLAGRGEKSQFWQRGVEKIRAVRGAAGSCNGPWEVVRREVLEEFCWVCTEMEDVFRAAWVEGEGGQSGDVGIGVGASGSAGGGSGGVDDHVRRSELPVGRGWSVLPPPPGG